MNPYSSAFSTEVNRLMYTFTPALVSTVVSVTNLAAKATTLARKVMGAVTAVGVIGTGLYLINGSIDSIANKYKYYIGFESVQAGLIGLEIGVSHKDASSFVADAILSDSEAITKTASQLKFQWLLMTSVVCSITIITIIAKQALTQCSRN